MKKTFLLVILSISLILISVPFLVSAEGQGIVPCEGEDCDLKMLFKMAGAIYSFITKKIATPLALLAITIGAILILISAGNPNLASTGKKVLAAGIIGLVLAYGSYLIVDFIMTTLKFKGNWANPSF